MEMQEVVDNMFLPLPSVPPILITKTEGVYLHTSSGHRIIDASGGPMAVSIGYGRQEIAEAAAAALRDVSYVLPVFATEARIELVKRIKKLLPEELRNVYFCSGGSEANEAAIKLARLHAQNGRYKIITFESGFHGRTLATTTATAQPKYHEGLGPLMAGFLYAPFGDLDAVAALIDDRTAAILIEPVQGEGGVRIPPEGFLAGLRKLADEQGLLLIFDEVQTGCGRTGEWFGYQHFGVTPDVFTLAKAVCGGLAGAAMVTTAAIGESLRPGMHAATFGGNPIAAAAGIATLETIEREGLLARAKELSRRFRERLAPLVDELGIVDQLRVCGLMIGLELNVDGAPIVDECAKRGLLINCTQRTVLRLLPAMTLADDELAEGCEILAAVLREYQV